MMLVVLDIDGVLVTTPPWKKVERLSDGFMQFNPEAAKNLQLLLTKTGGNILLISSHNHLFSTDKWLEIFKLRGININSLQRMCDVVDKYAFENRAKTLLKWVKNNPTPFILIDDDSSLHNLPSPLKQYWVQTKFLIGFNETCLNKALAILSTG